MEKVQIGTVTTTPNPCGIRPKWCLREKYIQDFLNEKNMKIICDTREQRPYEFHGAWYDGVEVEHGKLDTGDYSIKGFEGKVAVERKSLDDLMNCLGRDRERFMREMQRAAQGLEAFCVVVEANWRAIAEGAYRSHVKPQAAFGTIHAIMARMGIPITFAGSRAGAEFSTYSFLRQYLKGKEIEVNELLSLLGGRDTAKPKRRPGKRKEQVQKRQELAI